MVMPSNDLSVATPAASSVAAAPRVATTAPAAAAPVATAARIVAAGGAAAPITATPVVPGSVLALVGCATCPAHEEGDAPAMSAGRAHELARRLRGGHLTKTKAIQPMANRTTATVATLSIGCLLMALMMADGPV